MQSGRGGKKKSKTQHWEPQVGGFTVKTSNFGKNNIVSFSIPFKGHFAQKQVSTLHSITNTSVETLLTFSDRPNHHGVCQRERRQLRSSASKKRKRKKKEGMVSSKCQRVSAVQFVPVTPKRMRCASPVAAEGSAAFLKPSKCLDVR